MHEDYLSHSEGPQWKPIWKRHQEDGILQGVFDNNADSKDLNHICISTDFSRYTYCYLLV